MSKEKKFLIPIGHGFQSRVSKKGIKRLYFFSIIWFVSFVLVSISGFALAINGYYQDDLVFIYYFVFGLLLFYNFTFNLSVLRIIKKDYEKYCS